MSASHTHPQSPTATLSHAPNPRQVVRAAFALAAAISGVALGGGCSDPVVTPAQAVVVARMTGAPTTCSQVNSDWLKVGNFAGGNIKVREAIQTDQLFMGRTATVECRVIPNGDGFALKAQIILKNEGSVTIDAPKIKPRLNGADVTSDGVNVGFARGDSGVFTAKNCKVNFINIAEPTDIGNRQRDIAVGKAWGLINCEKAESFGSDKTRTCQAGVEFLLENCATE